MMPDLDSASMIIGEMKGKFDAMEAYIHKQFHCLRNEAQVQYGYFEKILSELKVLRENDQRANTAAHNELEERVKALEAKDTRRDGVVGAAGWFLQSPVIGWIIGLGGIMWGVLTGGRHP